MNKTILTIFTIATVCLSSKVSQEKEAPTFGPRTLADFQYLAGIHPQLPTLASVQVSNQQNVVGGCTDHGMHFNPVIETFSQATRQQIILHTASECLSKKRKEA